MCNLVTIWAFKHSGNGFIPSESAFGVSEHAFIHYFGGFQSFPLPFLRPRVDVAGAEWIKEWLALASSLRIESFQVRHRVKSERTNVCASRRDLFVPFR